MTTEKIIYALFLITNIVWAVVLLLLPLPSEGLQWFASMPINFGALFLLTISFYSVSQKLMLPQKPFPLFCVTILLLNYFLYSRLHTLHDQFDRNAISFPHITLDPSIQHADVVARFYLIFSVFSLLLYLGVKYISKKSLQVSKL